MGSKFEERETESNATYLSKSPSCDFSNLDAPLVDGMIEVVGAAGFLSKIPKPIAADEFGSIPIRRFISSIMEAAIAVFGTFGITGAAVGDAERSTMGALVGELEKLYPLKSTDGNPVDNKFAADEAAVIRANSGSSGYKDDFLFWCAGSSVPKSSSHELSPSSNFVGTA